MNYEKLIDFTNYVISKDGNVYSKYWNKPLKNKSMKDKGYIANQFKLKNGKKDGFCGIELFGIILMGIYQKGMK